jgi:LCP family protein required for cell wall assembly
MDYAQRRYAMSYGQPPRRGYGSTRRMDLPVPDQRVLPERRQHGDPRRGDWRPDPRRGDWEPGIGAPGQPPVPPGAPPRRKRRRIGRILLIILLAFVLLIGGIWLYLELNLNKVEALGDYPGRPAAGAGTNWLIVGSDSREGLSAEDQERLATGDAKGQRTDTMMLLHLPDNDTKATLVSLLRDSYVDIPGHGKDKLNAAYAYGGPKLLAQTVELNTKLRLDHYIEIGFGGFADLVDDVGGVDMCLDKPIDDPLAGIKLPAGCQELDGQQALGYVRTRKGGAADLDRVVRQREFIGALTDKATSAGTLLNPFRLVPLIANAPGAITVDSGDHLYNLPSLAFAIGGTSSGKTIATTVPIGGTARTKSGGAAVTWDPAKTPKLFDALRTDQPVPDNVIVNPTR